MTVKALRVKKKILKIVWKREKRVTVSIFRKKNFPWGLQKAIIHIPLSSSMDISFLFKQSIDHVIYYFFAKKSTVLVQPAFQFI